jgi:hypothetical protein
VAKATLKYRIFALGLMLSFAAGSAGGAYVIWIVWRWLFPPPWGFGTWALFVLFGGFNFLLLVFGAICMGTFAIKFLIDPTVNDPPETQLEERAEAQK